MEKLIVPLNEIADNLWDSLRIDSTLVDDTFNDVYLRVEGYEGKVMEFHTRITEEGLVLSEEDIQEVLIYNENEMPFHKRDVASEFIGLDDTFSFCRQIVKFIG